MKAKTLSLLSKDSLVKFSQINYGVISDLNLAVLRDLIVGTKIAAIPWCSISSLREIFHRYSQNKSAEPRWVIDFDLRVDTS